MKPLLVWLALTTPLLAASATDASQAVRFIACPVYRDTDAGLKSGCWLATDPSTGVQWDVTMSPYKPDWNHAVLVEGLVSQADGQPCGARVLEPVRTSLLASSCTRHMLPSEGLPGRKFVLPPRNIRPLSNPPAPPPDARAERTFTLFFEFDRSFVVYQYGDYLLDQAAHWIRATKPQRLVVTGFAASEPEIVSGVTLAERPAIAAERAETVALSLSRLFPDIPVDAHTSPGSRPIPHPDADGLAGQSQRRVEIRALF